MPNWCENTLTVEGEPKELKRFVFATLGLPAQYPLTEWEIQRGEKPSEFTEPYFCFNALVPTPKKVIDIGFDGHDKIPKEVYQKLALGDTSSVLDGYHWDIANWGTKWDVYHDHISPDEMGWSEGCDLIDFWFDTAWGPPDKWFEAVAKQFPALSFKLHYHECGCYFVGDMYYSDGELKVDDYDPDRCEAFFADIYEEENEN